MWKTKKDERSNKKKLKKKEEGRTRGKEGKLLYSTVPFLYSLHNGCISQSQKRIFIFDFI